MKQPRPYFSILTPVYRTPRKVLLETISSVRRQTCEDWELVLVNDGSCDPNLAEALNSFARRDPRIRVIELQHNTGISRASQTALEAARGDYVGLLDHDDILTDDALEVMKEVIEAEGHCDYIYSDEDKLDQNGRRYDAFRKPDWSPERLRGQMYTCHFSVIRREVALRVGGFREGFEGSQDHDLVLRVTEQGGRVVHVPELLYHWRAIEGSAAASASEKPYAWEAGRRAVQEHLERMGIKAEAKLGRVPGTYQITRRLSRKPLVSVVIPTNGGTKLIAGKLENLTVRAIRSILERVDSVPVEFVVVLDSGGDPMPIMSVCDEHNAILKIVEFTGQFNFSEKCNRGAEVCGGEFLLFLNDDVAMISEDGIEQLVAPLMDGSAMITGPRLVYENGRNQHVGVEYGSKVFSPYHIGKLSNVNAPGPHCAFVVNREVAAVTGAALAISAKNFEFLGGFCELFGVNYNDVDLCFKALSRGGRVLYVANTVMYHFESATRDRTVTRSEAELMKLRWGNMPDDPFRVG